MKALYAIFFFALSLSLPVTHAVADEALDTFKTAKKEYKKERYLEAARLFRKAYDLKPSWKLLYNIGQAEAAAKRYGLALEAFERYIAEAGDEITKKRQDEVRNEIDRLRDIVGLLEIKTHDGAEISVDGLFRGTAPVYGGIPVSAGVEHIVVVVFEGESLSEESVRVLGGRTVELTIMAEEAAPPEADRPVADPDSGATGADETVDESPRSGKKVLSIVTIALGAALVAGGAAVGGISLVKNRDLADNCDSGICPPGFEDTERSRNIMGITSAALLGAGTVAVVVGAVFLGRSRKAEARVGVYPMVGPELAGASLTLAF